MVSRSQARAATPNTCHAESARDVIVVPFVSVICAKTTFAESHYGRSLCYEGGLFIHHGLGHDPPPLGPVPAATNSAGTATREMARQGNPRQSARGVRDSVVPPQVPRGSPGCSPLRVYLIGGIAVRAGPSRSAMRSARVKSAKASFAKYSSIKICLIPRTESHFASSPRSFLYR
jgi:hypothetical protein